MITVYHWRRYNIDTDKSELQPSMKTGLHAREAGGAAIEGTGREIDGSKYHSDRGFDPYADPLDLSAELRRLAGLPASDEHPPIPRTEVSARTGLLERAISFLEVPEPYDAAGRKLIAEEFANAASAADNEHHAIVFNAATRAFG